VVVELSIDVARDYGRLEAIVAICECVVDVLLMSCGRALSLVGEASSSPEIDFFLTEGAFILIGRPAAH
jgi:hypothetical protein